MDDYKPQAWRMKGYYPGQYAKSTAALGIGIDYSDDDYDRYEAEFLADLAEHEVAVKREAAAVALEEARAKLTPPLNWNLDPYTGNERPGTPAVDEVYADVHRELTDIIEATRNPRTPGEETT